MTFDQNKMDKKEILINVILKEALEQTRLWSTPFDRRGFDDEFYASNEHVLDIAWRRYVEFYDSLRPVYGWPKRDRKTEV